jgi:hypothetical protein
MNNENLNVKPGAFSKFWSKFWKMLSLVFQTICDSKKSDYTCVNPKMKQRIHEGMCQVFNSQLGGF